MSPEVSLLVTVLRLNEFGERTDSGLVRCALKIPSDVLGTNWCYNDIWAFLPLHVRKIGPVVDVEKIFECCWDWTR